MQFCSFRLLKSVLAVLLTGALAGCVGAPQSAALLASWDEQALPLHSPILLDNVPFFAQDEYQCGPAALATVLVADGVEVTPEELVDQVYVPARQGSLQIEMLAAPRRMGRLSYPLLPELQQVLDEVASGRPVLVMQNLGLERFPQWHYAVVVGYDLDRGELTLRSGLIRDYRVSMRVFERTWSRAGRWAFVAVAPGEIPVSANEQSYFQAVTAFQGAASVADSQAAYAAGLARWPHSLELAMGQANLVYDSGDPQRTRDLYLDIVARHPQSAAAHNNLAQMLLETGDLGLAEEHARRAVALGGTFREVYAETLQTIRQEAADR